MPAAAPETAPQPYRVLVVDDEHTVLELMTDILEEAGWAVTANASPIDALEQIKRTRFDALVLDVYMPELPGMLFHAKVKLVDRELAARTIFVSGHFSRDELKRDLEEHAILVQKPFRPPELIAMIERVLPVKPRSARKG